MSAIVKGSSFRRQRAISALRKLTTRERQSIVRHVEAERAVLHHKRRAAALKAWETMRAKKAGLAVPVIPSKLYSVVHPESACAPGPGDGAKYEGDSVALQSRFAGRDLRGFDAEAKAFVTERGYEWLGAGISRAGVAIVRRPTCVLKIAYNRAGQIGNKEEVGVYKRVQDPNVKRLLVPVVAHSGKENWLLMPRVQTVDEAIGAEPRSLKVGDRLVTIHGQFDAIKVMKDELRSHDAFIPDLHQGNLAVTQDNRLVILDYGFGVSPIAQEATLMAQARQAVRQRHAAAVA